MYIAQAAISQRGADVTKGDALDPHIGSVTSWNYHLINIHSSEYVGLYYTWTSVWVVF